MRWMIYGANGYTGALIAERAVAQGHRPILAGRSQPSIRALAENLGCEHRVFALERTDEVVEQLRDVQLVLNAAGPFIETSKRMVAACLRTRTHYLDLAGEIDAIESTYERDADARSTGCVLLPAVGFSAVPLDCLATRLCTELPGATQIELAFDGYELSAGTAKTYVLQMAAGGAVRRQGKLVRVPLRWNPRDITFRDRTAATIAVPYGELASVYRSTGVPDIDVMFAPTAQLYPLVRFGLPFSRMLRLRPLRKLAMRAARYIFVGPDAAERGARVTQLWGRATDASGRAVIATAVTGEPYAFTINCTMAIIRRLERALPAPGALTPSMAFGWQLLDELGGDIRIEPMELRRTTPSLIRPAELRPQ
jgi:short subunit dehydrogenase-like uncharacterized protein